MNRAAQWLTAALLSTAAGLVCAEDLGVTMSIMVEDDQDLTGSISRQIELSEPVARQSRSERLRLLSELRTRLSEEQRQELLAFAEGEDLSSSDQLQSVVDGLNDRELKSLVDDLSGNSLLSLLEALDSNRAERLVEDLSEQEQEDLLDELIDDSDTPDTEEGPLDPLDPISDLLP